MICTAWSGNEILSSGNQTLSGIGTKSRKQPQGGFCLSGPFPTPSSGDITFSHNKGDVFFPICWHQPWGIQGQRAACPFAACQNSHFTATQVSPKLTPALFSKLISSPTSSKSKAEAAAPQPRIGGCVTTGMVVPTCLTGLTHWAHPDLPQENKFQLKFQLPTRV